MKRRSFDLVDGKVVVVSTAAADGNFGWPSNGGVQERELAFRRASVHPGEWTALRQVHSTEVALVTFPGEHHGSRADGAVTFQPDCPVSITSADCAPVVLVGTTGVAVVHAGWKGAAAGIIEVAAEQLLGGGSRPVATVVGPCIQPAAYEFGAAQLDRLTGRFGDTVEAVTNKGTRALDLHRLISVCCQNAGWPEPGRSACTSGSGFFSHRTRSDLGRQAMVAWIER